ncbi:TetR/AcrR family transcriptional regulator [Cellulosimicrobium cellulans]|uniref:TetR/AcrR family transcriptional regulator n=1 Tax=Cellulosimicrobium cellulans TaxID=1710 RepID=UPI002097CE3A|nr:TetR/AcrR family transcriptional regulator [Cellulosimicrobium cellulans]MCO7272110.1 TetR/AcrR family transcriptional regulator [Cellulosimicrobium cellulans]
MTPLPSPSDAPPGTSPDATPDAPAPERTRARPLSREERRDAIAAATIPLLVQHGAAVTTRQIADAAGVAEGTLFRAFADKDEILHAAVVRSLDPAPAVAAIADLPDDDGLRPLVVSIVEFLLEAQRVGMRIFAAAHQVLDPHRGGAHGAGAGDPRTERQDRADTVRRMRAGHGPDARRAGFDARERSAREIVGAIERTLVAHRAELRVDPGLAARAVFSLVFGNALPHLSGGDRLDAVQLADLILGGIGADVTTDPSP